METFNENIQLEFIKTGLSLIVLVLTWVLGQQIIIFWERRKKQKEIDSELASKFQLLYAEFKTVARLWKAQNQYMNTVLKDIKEKQWELLCRATNAEGAVEAILMKLSQERCLNIEDCNTLGYFRQGYQQLRESIRETGYIPANYNDASYKLFHNLSTKVSKLIYDRKKSKRVTLQDAEKNLMNIMRIRSSDWKQKLKEYDIQVSPNTEIDDGIMF